mgnify:CR=1 FL=1
MILLLQLCSTVSDITTLISSTTMVLFERYLLLVWLLELHCQAKYEGSTVDSTVTIVVT